MQKHLPSLTQQPSKKDTVPKDGVVFSDLIIRGTIFGLIAAIGYTAANVFLRYSVEVDPYWVSCVKAVPTMLLFSPWLLVRASRSQRLLPPMRAFLILMAAAVLGQVGGNVVFQWALGVIGIALTVPLCLGAMIITGAIVGWTVLKEQVTTRTLASIVLLIVAVSILSWGAPAAHASFEKVTSHVPWQVALGVIAACVSGVSYALLGVAIRNAAQQQCPATTTLVTVSIVGVFVLFPLCAMRMGIEQMWATDTADLKWMIYAGLANAIAFVALTRSLELVGVIYVNALNATQAAMAAVAGILLFSEPLSPALASSPAGRKPSPEFEGVVLTALGLLLMKRGGKTSDV